MKLYSRFTYITIVIKACRHHDSTTGLKSLLKVSNVLVYPKLGYSQLWPTLSRALLADVLSTSRSPR